MDISTPRGCAGGAAPPSANLGPPRLSETIRARGLKFFTHTSTGPSAVFGHDNFPLGCAVGGQAADREASSCNAPQLPRFLVYYMMRKRKLRHVAVARKVTLQSIINSLKLIPPSEIVDRARSVSLP